ncbi:hypothetical protein [Pseudoduganella armeniaca]|uniref:Uncharacterized protein n=1 Tax=Pseudoduganella armeniaca TaxID=2072590 RepID=A0A2R4C420_9BURK|nr:hypothetical protein [Pseudoduganella armeniaca]AVR94355.1 hypothetical protein C9I28_00500 [Pseudoduganella armeniaca]
MNDYLIESYVGVGPIKLGMKRDDVHALIGPPKSSSTADPAEDVVDYWHANSLQLTFSEDVRELVEISLYPGLDGVEFRGIKLFEERGVDVLKQLRDLDSKPRVITGVSIFLQLGLAVAGFEHDEDDDKSVTVFAHGLWDE